MDKIEELLHRGVDKIFPSKETLEKVLLSGKKLKLYQGFDPTGTQLHVGHMIGLRKLKQWQDLGHHVIFLIGDGTGQAGDPSGKIKAREKFFTREELRKNAKEYIMQASKIVRFDGENPVEILYNGDWLSTLTYTDILDIIGHFSLQQLVERDLFQDRIKRGETVNMREFIYPVLQGYDSVAMNVDLEIGGSDQTFNMLCGRNLVASIKHKEKFVMTTPLLEDSEGRKIGKSEGNVIGLTDDPINLYRKIMSLGDDVIIKGFEYLTDIPLEEIHHMKKSISDGENPMLFKKMLAFEIVKQLNNQNSAERAQIAFEQTVQKHELPNNIEELPIDSGSLLHEDFLAKRNLVQSKSEAKRLFQQGGIELNGQKILDTNEKIPLKNNDFLKVGKRKIVKLKI